MPSALELLRSGVSPHDPTAAPLTVRVHKQRFLRNGRVETGVFDAADLYVEFVPARALLDWTVLNEYLDSYRSWSGAGESCVATIADDLAHALAPSRLRVEMRIDGAGGYRYQVRSV